MEELLKRIEENKKNMRPEDAEKYEGKLLWFIRNNYPSKDVWEVILEYIEKNIDLEIYDTDYKLPFTYEIRCGYEREKNSGDSCTYKICITDENFKASVKQIDSYYNPCGDYGLESGPMYIDYDTIWDDLQEVYEGEYGEELQKQLKDVLEMIEKETGEKVEIKELDLSFLPENIFNELAHENDNWEPSSMDYKEKTFTESENMFTWIKETVEAMQDNFDKLEPWKL